MSDAPTLDVQSWLRSPLGQRVYALERKLAAEALAQVFGWQMLQIGLWGDDDGLIAEGRTQRRTVLAGAASGPQIDRTIRSRTDSLSIASDSLTRCMLPHTLEYEPEPHEILREVGGSSPAKATWWSSGFGRSPVGDCGTCSRKDGFPPGLSG